MESTSKWSNQFWMRGLKRGINTWLGARIVAMFGPFFQLHQAQAKARFSASQSLHAVRQ